MRATKQAIAVAFIHLMEEKPYNKITVNDIVSACGVNRNTFYYHFHDIPELLEVILKTGGEQLVTEYGNFGRPIDCLCPMIEYILQYKKIVLNVYRSEDRERFLVHLDKLAVHIAQLYLDEVVPGVKLLPEDRTLLTRFYKSVLVGVTLDWLEHKMDYDLLTRAEQLLALYPEAGKRALEACAERARQTEPQEP